jgi:hypothetical protein
LVRTASHRLNNASLHYSSVVLANELCPRPELNARHHRLLLLVLLHLSSDLSSVAAAAAATVI